MPTAKRNPHIDSASIECQGCHRELREDFLVYEGQSALAELQEFAEKIHRWSIGNDVVLCHLCATGKGRRRV